MNNEDFDQVIFPDGRPGFVPRGFGQQAQAMINEYGGRGARSGSGDTIGTFADGFEAVNQLLTAPDMQRDLDQARAVIGRLNAERDAYAAQLDAKSLPGGAVPMSLGDRWKRLQSLQDQRDYLQERIMESQIRLNYGSGLAAGGRAIGRVLGGEGGSGGGGVLDNPAVLAVGALGLGALLLRDRDGSGSALPPARYTP